MPVEDPATNVTITFSPPTARSTSSRSTRSWARGTYTGGSRAMRRALALDDCPTEARASLARLLSAEPVRRSLDLARKGRLRARAVAGNGASTAASVRIRFDCLGILARAGSVPAVLPERPQISDLKAPVGAANARCPGPG
ncbi:hypothetical protein ACIRL2_45285 [Embleya sp. NPDC127516]|uniref:hypothetical protein n=1 Tax=Embleya sp. NPDC127516 TaxID=3363990 RepID=UPI0037F7D383